MIDQLTARLDEYGLILRGGFHPAEDDPLSPGVKTLLLVGNAGSAMWRVFDQQRTPHDHAMDIWTKEVLDGIAAEFGATALYPFGGPPWQPFQRWAMQAEGLAPSPIFMLMHPDYGLWHAYRGALAFAELLDLPAAPAPAPSPCRTCAAKPCLTSCPVGAFTEAGYDTGACAAHMRRPEGEDCLTLGCRARRACPVGRDFTYDPPHAAFHMEAFLRARR